MATKAFRTFVKEYAKVSQLRDRIAERFVKAFFTWRAKQGEATGRYGTLADYARTIDPSVPEAAAEYHQNLTFRAADFLVRSMRALHRPNGGRQDQSYVSPLVRVMVTAFEAMIKSSANRAKHPDKVWAELRAQLPGVGDRAFHRLRRQVENYRQFGPPAPGERPMTIVGPLRGRNDPRVVAARRALLVQLREVGVIEKGKPKTKRRRAA